MTVVRGEHVSLITGSQPDRKIMEYGWGGPLNMKARGSRNKRPLF